VFERGSNVLAILLCPVSALVYLTLIVIPNCSMVSNPADRRALETCSLLKFFPALGNEFDLALYNDDDHRHLYYK